MRGITNKKIDVADLIDRFLAYAENDYLTRQPANLRSGLSKLQRWAGDLPAAEFRALALRDFRDALVKGELSDSELSREYVNRVIRFVKQAWKWAVSMELLPTDAYQVLCTVDPLKEGRTTAPEREPVEPVEPERVYAILDELTEDMRDILRLMMLTGARTGEIRQMISGDIDMDRDDGYWALVPGLYKPEDGQRVLHKTRHHGKVRAIPLDAECQKILMRRVNPFIPRCVVFPSPRTGGFYGKGSVYTAVKRACERLGAPHFHPHQIRHHVLDKIEKHASIGDAQALAGHSSIDTTKRYTTLNLDPAIRGMQALRRAGAP